VSRRKLQAANRILPEIHRKALRALADDLGLARAATTIGVTRQTFAALLAGLPTQPMTVAGVRTRLTEIANSGKELAPDVNR